jgi:cation-transporting ATPase 13A2
MVIRSNFSTTKGSLIKSILYPKPNRFNFYADALKFIGVMGIISLFGWISSIDASLKYLSIAETIERFLDLITITVPPALPAAMSMGVMFALGRLRENQVYCISPPRVNVAGRVSTVVFDKTGTLTEEGLDVAGLRCMKTHSEFYQIVEKTAQLFDEGDKFWAGTSEYEAVKNTNRMKYLECMAACH